MVDPLLKAIQSETSGERPLMLLGRLASCHRIQSSPGFREAARLCEEAARSWGLETEIHTFPADGSTSFWGCPIPMEWEAHEATLELIEPQRTRLADFTESRISLIQRSAPAQMDSAEIVMLQDGLERAEYKNVDVSGKLVLTKGNVERVHELAVQEFGAAGILFDGIREVKPVRTRADLPDARQYTSFWWRPEDRKCFGFVLTPRQGDWLRGLLAASTKPRARVSVRAEFRPGEMEVLSCFIPGETLEEVLLVAHLCHPQPSANDNASGCVSVLEAMRTIKTLVESGEIGPLKRGVRALLLPEMTGSIAYLANHEERLPDLLCALNVDMAGENQTLCGSTLLLETPPDACAGFSTELGTFIQRRVFNIQADEDSDKARSLGQERLSLYPFAGASDHLIFSDPDVGIPCPSLCQWPDRFYHTDADTPDKVDPAMLSASAAIAACYAAFAATAGEREARWLSVEMLTSLKQAVTEEVRQQLTSAIRSGSSAKDTLALLRKKLSYMAERKKEALVHLRRLGARPEHVEETKEEVNEWVRREFADAERNCMALLSRSNRSCGRKTNDTPERNDALKSAVPSRILRGPSGTGMVARSFWGKLNKRDRERLWQLLERHKRTPDVFRALSWFWVNGRRSLADIADLVEMETGVRDDELLGDYYSFLEKVGLVSVSRRGGGN
ncbi:MAG: DUF4910 domain-containing protein [Candidatus Eiseniibacteriota bacterium]|nr:MAG: DUF4910 domain-containing protein [Candidatus Eisenbacteria bacterium]